MARSSVRREAFMFGSERILRQSSHGQDMSSRRGEKTGVPTPVFCAKSAEGHETIGDSVFDGAKECVRV